MANKALKADASTAAAAPAGETPLSDAEKASPVLRAVGKRMRAARKKLNRISQLEQRKADGKELNADQVSCWRSDVHNARSYSPNPPHRRQQECGTASTCGMHGLID